MSLRTEKALVSLCLAALLGPLFFRVSALTAARNMAPPPWLPTALDQRMPVVAAAVWVYLSWYPAAFAVLLGDRDTFRRAAGAYLLAFMACLVGYLALPVTIARPSIAHAHGLSLVILRALYAFDPPVNVFPSFHAAVAAILWRLRPASRIGSGAVSAWTVALCGACVLTHQHYVLDVIAGLAVGGIAVTVVDLGAKLVRPDGEANSLYRPLGGLGDHRVARLPLSPARSSLARAPGDLEPHLPSGGGGVVTHTASAPRST